MVAGPPDTPVTSPAVETVATPDALVVQAADDVTFVVVASDQVAVAVSCCVAPIWIVAVEGLTAIESSTAAAAVTVAVPLFPASDAVIVALPVAASAFASPAASTETTDAALEDQAAEAVTLPVVASV